MTVEKTEIEVATDICIERRDALTDDYVSWETFWEILGWAIPKKDTIERYKWRFYIRSATKENINKEFVKQKIPAMLVVKRLQGVKLLLGEEAIAESATSGVKKIIRTHNRKEKAWQEQIDVAKHLGNVTDTNGIKKLLASSEAAKDHFVGKITRSKLPISVKKAALLGSKMITKEEFKQITK